MGARSQRKGAAGERELAALLSDLLGVEAERRGYLQRRGASVCPDVDWPGSLFWVECKRAHRVDFRAALHQAVAAATDERIPVVIGRDDGGEPLAMMRVEDWASLARAYDGERAERFSLVEKHWQTQLAELVRENGEHLWLPIDWFASRRSGERLRLVVQVLSEEQ
jgi:hypothetical protein